jgi:protein-S-isoprenylcysteine O-methyltransferase Ste14
MYLAVGAIITGQGLILGRAVLIAYLAAYATAVTGFVHGYEEPTLHRRYGPAYDHYRHVVRRWLPHLTPWNPHAGPTPTAPPP